MTSANRGIRQIRIANDPTDISGQFKKKKDIFYKFNLKRSSNIYVSLSGFSANTDVDVQILNSKQRVLSKSTNAGGASEFISKTLKRGEYLVRLLNKRSKVKTNFQLKIATADAAPTVKSQPFTAQRGQTIQITSANLKALDALQASDRLHYTLTQSPRNGVLQLNGQPMGIGGSFTQADIDQGRVTYRSTNQGMTMIGKGTTPLVSGFNVVWVGPGGSDGGTDNEVFFYDGSKTRQLTQNAVEDKVRGIDGSHVVWASQLGAADSRGATYELFSFDGATVNRLTNNAVNEDFIGVSGENLFWTSPIGAPDQYGQPTYEVFYSRAGNTQQLTSNGVNEAVEDFEGATAVWEAALGSPGAAGRATTEIFFFDGSVVKPITNNAVDDSTPRLDQGKITWSSKVGPLELGVPTGEIFFFDGTTSRQLTFNTVDDFTGEIEGNLVSWVSRSGPTNGLGLKTYELFRFDGTNTQRLTTNAWDDSVVRMDGGNLLSIGSAGQPDPYGQRTLELFFFDGTKTTQLTTNQVDDIPAGLKGSKVVWYSQTGAARQGAATRELFYFDGKTIQRVTNDDKNDDYPSFSETTLAWRSTDGVTSNIMKYDLGDSFGFKVSDGLNSSLEQVMQVDFV